LEACRACLYVECLHLPFAVDKPRCHKFSTPQLSSDLDPVERVWPAACRWHSHFAGTRKDRIAAKRRSAKMEGNNITQQIMAIQRDPNLTDVEKSQETPRTAEWKVGSTPRVCHRCLVTYAAVCSFKLAALATDLFKFMCQTRKVQQLQSQRSLPCSMTV